MEIPFSGVAWKTGGIARQNRDTVQEFFACRPMDIGEDGRTLPGYSNHYRKEIERLQSPGLMFAVKSRRLSEKLPKVFFHSISAGVRNSEPYRKKESSLSKTALPEVSNSNFLLARIFAPFLRTGAAVYD